MTSCHSVGNASGGDLFAAQFFLAVLQRCHIVVMFEILKECGLGIIADDAADLADALAGSPQQPACVIHAGTQQLLAEIHAVMLQKHSGQLPLGQVQCGCQLIFRAVAGHIVFEKGVDHIGAPVRRCFGGTVAGGIADLQLAKQGDHQLGQQGREQIPGEGGVVFQLLQDHVA